MDLDSHPGLCLLPSLQLQPNREIVASQQRVR